MARGKGRRYSRIIRASRLRAARQSYADWLEGKKDRQRNVGTGRPRPERVDLVIKPFVHKLEGEQYVKVGAEKPTWDTHGTKMGTRTKTLESAGNAVEILEIRGYCEARIVAHQGKSNTGTPKTSNTTGQKYLDYGGTRFSLPFGRATTNDEYDDAIRALEPIFEALPSTSVSFLPEG